LTNWTTADPYYSHPNFNAATGVFTVPSTGRYSIKATINYVNPVAISIALGAGVNPYFAVQRIAPAPTNLITGLVPIIAISVAGLVNIRGILNNGVVTIAGDVTLNAGDTVGLFYVSTGSTIQLFLGNSGANGIVWSMHRIA
jgi:hypothetical protein